MSKTKPCSRPGCNGILTRSSKDSRTKWEGRKYCCTQCAYLVRTSPNYEASKRAHTKPKVVEYVMPQDFKSLVGYVSVPPQRIAAGVMARYLRGAMCSSL